MIHDLFLAIGGTDHMYANLVRLYEWDIRHEDDSLTKRAYHTMDHVRQVVSVAEKLGFQNDARMRRLLVAAFYHDAIYHALPNNEMHSALHAQNVWNSALDTYEIGAVVDIILVTASHRNPHSLEERCMIDADLWGLGSAQHNYWANSYRVKAEDPTNWFERRKKFLEDFLGRDRIFWTKQGAEREEQARFNLQEEHNYVMRKLSDGSN